MLSPLLDLVLPRVCFVCGIPLHRKEQHLCLACQRNLPISAYPASYQNPTAQKFRARAGLLWGYSFMEFTTGGISQKIMHALKYQNAKEIIPRLFEKLDLQSVGKAYDLPQCIVPVPLHPKKLRQRGYNQATVIAQALAEKLRLPLNDTAVVRTQYNLSQTKKDKYLRHGSAKGLFSLVGELPHSVLLVDDVITTGATLHGLLDTFPKNTQFAIFTLARA